MSGLFPQSARKQPDGTYKVGATEALQVVQAAILWQSQGLIALIHRYSVEDHAMNNGGIDVNYP